MKTWSSPPVPQLPGHGSSLRVHDTAVEAETVVHAESGHAGLYVCGITPYDATHMGHAATYVTFDLVGRVWRDAGLQVTYVQNVTDVDEPLLERAERDGVPWQDLAEGQIELFRQDMEALRVIAPEHYVGAIEGIPDDVAAVRALLAEGTAYALPVEGTGGYDVYLDLASQPGFGDLSGWTREQMLEVFAERGGDPDRPGKRDRLDPLLWRGHREGEPHWDGGELGPGRPGWHIECTTIALRYLGRTFDLQGGGTDLVFPHHEMSAVQGEALTGEPFARAYVHQAMVGLDGEKMSKSKGNLVIVSALRESGVDPMAIRLALLARHYSTPWDWTDSLLDEAVQRLARWRAAVGVESGAASAGAGAQVGSAGAGAQVGSAGAGTEVGSAGAGTEASPSEVLADADGAARAVLEQVRRALAQNLDSPAALRAVDEWVATGAQGDRALVRETVDSLLGVAL